MIGKKNERNFKEKYLHQSYQGKYLSQYYQGVCVVSSSKFQFAMKQTLENLMKAFIDQSTRFGQEGAKTNARFDSLATSFHKMTGNNEITASLIGDNNLGNETMV